MAMYEKLKKNTFSNEEVTEIIKDFQEHGKTEENEIKVSNLIKQYVDFIYHLGHKFYPTYMKTTEGINAIEQAGMCGIAIAMKSFDTTRNVAFQTWAQRFILNEIRDYISIEVNGCSVYFNKNLRKVKDVIKDYEALEIPYTDEDIIMALNTEDGLSEKIVRDCLAHIEAEGKISLENYVVESGNNTVSLADTIIAENADFQDPAEIYEKNAKNETIFDQMHSILNDDEFSILIMACVDKMSAKDISEKDGRDELTITRIINAGVTKIQVAFGKEYDKHPEKKQMADLSFGDFFLNNNDDLGDISFGDFKLA